VVQYVARQFPAVNIPAIITNPALRIDGLAATSCDRENRVAALNRAGEVPGR
jgi:hypothetical protein